MKDLLEKKDERRKRFLLESEKLETLLIELLEIFEEAEDKLGVLDFVHQLEEFEDLEKEWEPQFERIFLMLKKESSISS